MENTKRLRSILIQFLVYISLFIGTGFLSGAIVHFQIDPPRFLVLGIIGAIIFVAASTINEAIFNKKDFKEEGLAKVIFFSLILSLGIGMISGGVQHFEEFPEYATYLIPLGGIVALVGYLLKSNIHLQLKQLLKLTIFSVIIVGLLFVGLQAYAKTIDTSSGHGHGNESARMPASVADHSSHAATVTDDKSFIEGMIPHHEEAITTSEEILTVTTNPEIEALAQGIIDAQKKEVADMKGWHKAWFDAEYEDNGQYQPMMQSIKGKGSHEAEETYLQGMIEHHNGAIAMAQEVLKKTERAEIKTLANNIISTQNQEISKIEQLLVDIEAPLGNDGHSGH